MIDTAETALAPAIKARDVWVARIERLCRELNQTRDTITWTRARLDQFINHEFETTDGLDSMAFESFPLLEARLRARLDGLQGLRQGSALNA